VPLAFANHHELVKSDAVDVVAVTVKVPHHLELATAALDAGKAVYCEWLLGNGWPRPRRWPHWRGSRMSWRWPFCSLNFAPAVGLGA
jgi:hypothetical protein